MRLSRTQSVKLACILKANGYEHDEFLAGFGTSAFPVWKIEQLCNWVNDEFMLRGLNADGAVNSVGQELEELLDTLNRQRLSI